MAEKAAELTELGGRYSALTKQYDEAVHRINLAKQVGAGSTARTCVCCTRLDTPRELLVAATTCCLPVRRLVSVPSPRCSARRRKWWPWRWVVCSCCCRLLLRSLLLPLSRLLLL